MRAVFHPPGPRGPRENGNKTGIEADHPGSATGSGSCLAGWRPCGVPRHPVAARERCISGRFSRRGPSLPLSVNGAILGRESVPTSVLAHRPLLTPLRFREASRTCAWSRFLRSEFYGLAAALKRPQSKVRVYAARDLNKDPPFGVFKIVDESSLISVQRYQQVCG